MTPAPSEAKSPRRDDGPGQTVAHQVALHHAPVDWSAYLFRIPSCGGLAPTTDRSEYPASRQRKKKGLTRGPLQKGGQRRVAPCPRAALQLFSKRADHLAGIAT